MPDSEPSPSETRGSDGGENSCSTSEPPNNTSRRAGRVAHNSCHRPATVTAAVSSQDDDALHCRRGTDRRMQGSARFPPPLTTSAGPAPIRNACPYRGNRVLPRPPVCQGDRSTARDAAYGCCCLFFFSCFFLPADTALRGHVRVLLSLFTSVLLVMLAVETRACAVFALGFVCRQISVLFP